MNRPANLRPAGRPARISTPTGATPCPSASTIWPSAWSEESAWTGDASVGGVMPAEFTAIVALDEVVLHGWDLALATGQKNRPDPADVEVVHSFVEMALQPDQAEMRAGLFGPSVERGGPVSAWERALILAGRDPSWPHPQPTAPAP